MSKWTLPLGEERWRSQKHRDKKETPRWFCDNSENPSGQWKWREGNHRTGRDKAFSLLLRGSERQIQALPNPEAEVSFRWLSGWMIAAKVNMVLAAKYLSTLPPLAGSAHAADGRTLQPPLLGFLLGAVERGILEIESSSQEQSLHLPSQILSFL